MFHRSCALCGQPAVAATNLGPLLGPIRDSKSSSADELFAHRLCAIWSSEVYETDSGTLRNVLAAIKRGRQMKCACCGRRGATLGCRVPTCNYSYHVACAKDAGCTFFCDQFLIACPDHAKLFHEEARQQSRRTPFTPYRYVAVAEPAVGQLEPAGGQLSGGEPGPTPQAGPGGEGEELVSPPTELPTIVGRKRGRRQEAARQHLINARAAMKRARRELERQRLRAAESSDDEEHFQKKETARLARDTAKLNRITLQGDGTAVQHVYVKSPAPAAAAAAGTAGVKGKDRGLAGPGMLPTGQRGSVAHLTSDQQQQASVETAVVGSIATTDFSSVGGLDDVVRQLREMVLLPMQYPDLFEGMGLKPPRGILFHGVPGTGKTLVARALAGACAKHSPLPVTFFARKGADCLGKFHGEAERTLRLLFEEASRRAPAIIFLDELDALVPARAARAGGSDQIYASVVSTLLTLMDGVTDRGNVIVIGATNRPEAIDPALRRPGRFDREVYFGLPTPQQRLAILKVHTAKWRQPPAEALLRQVASRAEGFAGADLQALCTAAVMAAVRRSAPLLLELADREAAAGDVAASADGAGRVAHAEDRREEQRQGESEQERERQQSTREQLLQRIEVQPSDWREALAAAPPPCSRRHGMAALAAEVAAPLQRHALSLLARPLAQLLAALHAANLPLPAPAAAAAAVAAAGQQAAASASSQEGRGAKEAREQQLIAELAAVLRQHGALLEPAGSSPAAATSSPVGTGTAAPIEAGTAAEGGIPAGTSGSNSSNEQHRLLDRLGRSYVPCRLLLWGEGEQGQEAAAGALLKLLDGCPVHCLSLPSLVAEGGNDAAAGCVALVGEALRRASPHTPCIFYLPRLEAWALSEARVEAESLQQAGWYARPPGAAGSQQRGADAGGKGQEPASARRSGLVSPSFRATTPAGASPGHRGFLVAPSPFSGLLPLEDRVSDTPAVARALRTATQPHREQQQQQEQEQQHGRGDTAEERPTLLEQLQRSEQRQQRQRSVGAEVPPLALPPALLEPPAGLLPIRTSPKQPGLPSGAPDVAAADPAAALPIRTQMDGRPGSRPSLAGLHTEEEEEEEEESTEVEVVCLSQVWSVFESLMRQVPAGQPIILLATCHAAADATPANLAHFFAGPALAPAPAQRQEAQQQQREREEGQQQPRLALLQLEGGAGPDAAAVEAPGIVRMQPPGASAWRQAADAAAEQVAGAVATQAALLLHQRLLHASPEELQAAGVAVGEQPTAAGRGLEAPPTQQPEHQQQQPGLSPSQEQEEEARQPELEPQPEQCNTAELEQGLRLFDQLLTFQRQLAAKLAAEQVQALDRWAAGAASSSKRRGGNSAPPTFSGIASRCRVAAYDSVDDMQADAAAAAAYVLALVEEEQGREARERRRGGRQPSPDAIREQAPMAATAACALQDEVDAACFWLRQQLQLGEPLNVRLLAAAAAHVRRLQRQRQAEEERRRQQEQQQQEQEQQEGSSREEAEAGDWQAQQEGGIDAAGREGALQQAQLQTAAEAQTEGADVYMPGAAGQDIAACGPAKVGQALPEHAAALQLLSADTSAPATEQQSAVSQPQQEHQQPDAAEATAIRDQHHRWVIAAAQLLRRHLVEVLLPAVRQRLPPAAAWCGSAWQALQEAAGRLSTAAVAACGEVMGQLDGMEGVEVPEAGCDEAAAEAQLDALTSALAARCRAAFEVSQAVVTA